MSEHGEPGHPPEPNHNQHGSDGPYNGRPREASGYASYPGDSYLNRGANNPRLLKALDEAGLAPPQGYQHGWMLEWTAVDEYHVLPVADKLAHEYSEHCACLPTAELIQGTDVGDTTGYSHNAWDGRE